MVNLVWVAMAVIGIVYAMINGTMEEVNKAVFDGAKDAVTICIGLISVLVFWLGLMKIAEEAGLLKKLVTLFMPIVKRLFPEIPKDHPSMGFILSNMMANFFGLGNAATPLGIKAMEQLKELNGGKDSASRSMVTFLALNTSAITGMAPTLFIASTCEVLRIIANTVCPFFINIGNKERPITPVAPATNIFIYVPPHLIIINVTKHL